MAVPEALPYPRPGRDELIAAHVAMAEAGVRIGAAEGEGAARAPSGPEP